MNYKIYVVAEKQEIFFLEAIKEYEKRLSRYCKTKFYSTKNNEALQKRIKKREYYVGISSTGTQLSSEQFADRVNQWGITGNSEVVILLNAIDIPCDEMISLSQMDISPILRTTILYEQLYRAYRILNHEPYHK